jgi:uncharacterized cofD-like protein
MNVDQSLTVPSQCKKGVVVLGSGRGLDSVLRALRNGGRPLTAIVSIAYEHEADDDVRHRLTGATVEDLRRSLEALAGEQGALLKAITRPLTIERLGRHTLGNLVLASVAAAFDDYGHASLWLGEQLGATGVVLPATVRPVRTEIETVAPASTPGSSAFRQLHFVGERVDSPRACVDAIKHARCVVLAPGALYRTILSTAAVPALAGAVQGTSAPVVWLANLEPDVSDAPELRAIDYLRVLRMHGVRVDAVVHDPAAGLRFDSVELEQQGVRSLPGAFRRAGNPALHDPDRVRAILEKLLSTGSLDAVCP